MRMIYRQEHGAVPARIDATLTEQKLLTARDGSFVHTGNPPWPYSKSTETTQHVS